MSAEDYETDARVVLRDLTSKVPTTKMAIIVGQHGGQNVGYGVCPCHVVDRHQGDLADLLFGKDERVKTYRVLDAAKDACVEQGFLSLVQTTDVLEPPVGLTKNVDPPRLHS